MIVNATATATACVAIVAMAGGSHLKPPSMRWASAGSPTQPRPREARVIPSWVAEM